MLSASTTAPGRSLGASIWSIGRYISFQPSSSSRSIGPATSRKRLARIAKSDFGEAREARLGQVRGRGPLLARLQLRADHPAAFVARRRRRVEGGDPEGGAELHDPPRAQAARHQVEETALKPRDRDVDVLEEARLFGRRRRLASEQHARHQREVAEKELDVAARRPVQSIQHGLELRIVEGVHGRLRIGVQTQS